MSSLLFQYLHFSSCPTLAPWWNKICLLLLDKKKKHTLFKKMLGYCCFFVCVFKHLLALVCNGAGVRCTSGLLLLFYEEVHSLCSRTSWPIEKRTQNNTLNHLNAESTLSFQEENILPFQEKSKINSSFLCRTGGHAGETFTLKCLLQLVDAHQVPAISMCFLPAYLCVRSHGACVRADCKRPPVLLEAPCLAQASSLFFSHSVSD